MKAVAVYPGRKGSAHLREVEKPVMLDGEVLVKTLYAGVCGTDREINQGIYGTAPNGEDYLILGHEAIGIIEDVGASVEGLQKGDYVVRTVRRSCGRCDNCKAGANDMCSTGNYTEAGIKGVHGCMAEYFKDVPDYLVKVSGDYKEVSVLLEPLSVVEKATREAFEIQKRMSWNLKKALVVGSGPIGLLEAMVLRSLDVETYVAARSKKGNLKSLIAEEAGAKYISLSDTSLYDLKGQVGNIDFIFEASGSSDMAFQAMEVLGINGVLCLSSITGGSYSAAIPCDRINIGMVLGNKCVFGAVNANIVDYESGVSRLKVFRERWPGMAENLITKTLPIERFKEGFAKEGIKSVIRF